MKGLLKKCGVCLCLIVALFVGDVNAQTFPIQAAVIQSNCVSFSFFTVTNRLYLVESADEANGYWNQETNLVGNGVVFSFTNVVAQHQQFFRIESRPQTNLALFPSLPLLATNVVSLPDAVAGNSFSQEISPGQSGFPPYQIQFGTNLPDGVTATILSNDTATAKLLLNGSGTNLIAGERTRFDVWITDAQSVTVTQRYDLRVVAPAPTVLLTQAELKAGATANVTLDVTNAAVPLSWKLLSGPMPEGITFGTNGTLTGTPTASAAEYNEDGLYFNSVQLLDSFTDRVTGQIRQRSTTTNIVQRVRLSYVLNIYAVRTNGPSVGTICTKCHGGGFEPAFDIPDATAIIYEGSGSGGECFYGIYVWPGDAFGSLIWQKIHDTPPRCGNRMPADGNYLNATQINRMARWINELTDDDVD